VQLQAGYLYWYTEAPVEDDYGAEEEGEGSWFMQVGGGREGSARREKRSRRIWCKGR
jgi:hypothetical protein